MIPRRIAALIMSLTLVHLSAARADAACASHPDRAVTPVSTEASDPHAHHAAPVRTPAPGEEECDAPQTRDCCAAVAACAIAFDADVRGAVEGSEPTGGVFAPAHQEIPPSPTDAPEPPPPRA